jgi:hypothetical protein
VRLSRDALLLRPEQVNVDGALVVGVHDLPALGLQLHQAARLEGSLVAIRGVAGDDIGLQNVSGLRLSFWPRQKKYSYWPLDRWIERLRPHTAQTSVPFR